MCQVYVSSNVLVNSTKWITKIQIMAVMYLVEEKVVIQLQSSNAHS